MHALDRTRSIFTEDPAYQSLRDVLGTGPDERRRLLKAVLDQQWQEIEEYSEVIPQESGFA